MVAGVGYVKYNLGFETTRLTKSGDEIQIGKFHLVFISNKSGSTNSQSDNK
jgi:hypothetical protein